MTNSVFLFFSSSPLEGSGPLRPVFTKQPGSIVFPLHLNEPSREVTFSCEAQGHPPPSYRWDPSVPLILVSKRQDKFFLIIFCQWQRQIDNPYYLINLFNLSSSSSVRTLEVFLSSLHMLGISNMKGTLFQATKDTLIYQRVKLSIADITESPLYCCCSPWFDSSWVKTNLN